MAGLEPARSGVDASVHTRCVMPDTPHSRSADGAGVEPAYDRGYQPGCQMPRGGHRLWRKLRRLARPRGAGEDSNLPRPAPPPQATPNSASGVRAAHPAMAPRVAPLHVHCPYPRFTAMHVGHSTMISPRVTTNASLQRQHTIRAGSKSSACSGSRITISLTTERPPTAPASAPETPTPAGRRPGSVHILD
jgi:hypothetical protein